MRRRTLLQWFAATVAAGPIARLHVFAQAPTFTSADKATLNAIADVVLPGALGARGRRDVVDRFTAWFVNYRSGADMGHGYGNDTVRNPSGAAPGSRYPEQLAAFEKAARDKGAASFAALALADRHVLIEAALSTLQAASRMPARPNGANVTVDLMGFYFNSGDAYDLCYNAAIGREHCRGLDGSDRAPSALTGGR